MKSWIVVSGSLVALASASVAFACSPPILPPQVDIIQLGTPTAIAYSFIDDGSGDGQARLVGPAGEVEGTIERSEKLWNMVLFKPTEPLENGEYELTVTAGFDYAQTMETEMVTVSGALSSTDIELEIVGGIHEGWSDLVCCSTVENGCDDSCGDCTVCWPAGYEYSRQVDITVTSSEPRVVELEMTVDLEGEQKQNRQVVTLDGEAGTSISRVALEAGEVCITARELDFEGNELSTLQECLRATDFPSVDRRAPDVPELVAQCVEPPNDTEDPNWQRYQGLSKVSGCSMVGTPTSPLAAVWILGWFGLRRRKR